MSNEQFRTERTKVSRAFMMALALVLTSAFALGLAPQEASAEDDSLGAVLKGLSWNDNKEKVFKHFKKLKNDEFLLEAKKTRDPLVKEKLRRRKNNEYKRVTDSYKDLKGKDSTGYEASVIGEEYKRNSNDSVMAVRDEYALRYYIFSSKRLWKMVVSYRPAYIEGIGFEAFVEQVSRKYGEPDDTEFADDGDGKYLARAVWRDEDTELRIEDKTSFHNTFTMVFAEVNKAERFNKVREKYAKRGTKNVMGRDIADIQEEGNGVGEDVLDSIVGKVELDLEQGMPEDAKLRRVGDKAAVASANTDLPTEKRKKRKKAKKRKARKTKANKKKSNSLIIY